MWGSSTLQAHSTAGRGGGVRVGPAQAIGRPGTDFRARVRGQEGRYPQPVVNSEAKGACRPCFWKRGVQAIGVDLSPKRPQKGGHPLNEFLVVVEIEERFQEPVA